MFKPSGASHMAWQLENEIRRWLQTCYVLGEASSNDCWDVDPAKDRSKISMSIVG